MYITAYYSEENYTMHPKLCLRDAKTKRNLNCEWLLDSLNGVAMVIY